MEKTRYTVYVNGTPVKSYPYKAQATAYCFLSGYVSTGRGLYFLHPDVQVRKERGNED